MTHETQPTTVRGAVSLDNFSVMNPGFLDDPYPYFAEMRRQQPVFPTQINGMPVWIVTTDALCREVLEDPATYSSHFSLQGKPSPEAAARGAALREELGGYPRVNMLVTEDPPRHTRFRKLVAGAFTPRTMMKWQDQFVDLANMLVDDFDGSTRIEAREAFTNPMGLRAIALIMGVDNDRLDDFAKWGAHTIVGLGTEITDEEYLDGQRSIVEFQNYFADLVADRRANPREDDMISRLISARLNPDEAQGSDGDPLTLPELLEMFQTLLGAASHTTTRAMSEMLHQLAVHPHWWEQACTNPDSRAGIIEESVRFAAPAVALWRRVTRETELGGVRLPARAKLLVSFGSATRDESVISHPDEFDPERDELRGHLAWGRGIHACLGQNLARAELRATLDVLTTRVAGIELADGRPPEYERNYIARGVSALELDLTYR